MKNIFRTSFSESIFNQKYKHEGAETWEQLSETLIRDVCGGVLPEDEIVELIKYHSEMKFIAGGRYLYYAGRENKYFNNCYLLKSLEDSREDWANLSWKAESCLATGGGIGNDYSIYRPKGASIAKTGGKASGPISKMKMINEIGREVMQGGSRRSAIYASLNWQHADAGEFLHCKDWHAIPVSGAFDESGKQITIGDLKEKDFNFPAPLDMTNISLNYDNDFLEQVYELPLADIKSKFELGDELEIKKVPITFLENVRQALKTGEPGFSFNFFDKVFETLRNACVTGDTEILTYHGYRRIDELVGQSVDVWNGFEWSTVTPEVTGHNQHLLKITLSDGRSLTCTDYHKWVSNEGVLIEAKDLKVGLYIKDHFLPRISNYNIPKEYHHTGGEIVSIEDAGYADTVYCFNEPLRHYGIFNGILTGQCTEVTSEDDSDVCNLASINMAMVESVEEMERVSYLASRFLYCGTLKAKLPYKKVYEVREKNRRLGLGIMGVHEWLLRRGYKYQINDELRKWLRVWAFNSEIGADKLAEQLGMSKPVAYRAIAPTGSIGILAGTTTGIEPLYAVAYKRRYLKDKKEWHYQYVIDGTAKILIQQFGVDPDKIETALSLAQDPERRIKFQADVQDYVDMSISSTINLPAFGSDMNNDTMVGDFARILLKYAHRLRGFTCYPDGSRGGQPLTAVPYLEAKAHEGAEFKETFHDVCEINGKGGTCGA